MNKRCHLLWSNIEGDVLDQQYESYLEQLPDPIRRRLAKYPSLKDKYLSLTGKLLLAKGLQAYDIPAEVVFNNLYYTSKGRPFLEGIDVDFNISHSGSFVVCALSTDCQVGIDVQQRIPITRAKASLFIGPADLSAIDFETQSHILIDIWTRKEAASKLVGDGLSISFKSMLLNQGNYTHDDKTLFLYPVQLDKAYSCALASSQALNNISIQVVELKDLLLSNTIHS